MPRPVLFFIHGMGKHGPKWADDAISKLDKCAERYPSMADKTMSQLFELVPIADDSVFTGVIDRWAVEVQALKTNALDEPVKGAVDWLDGSARGDFIWIHIADVILYMGSAVRNAVVAHVAAEIAGKIKARGLANVSYNIVAHSLGTSVAAEAVTALATPSSYPDGWQGMPSGFRFSNVFMVANPVICGIFRESPLDLSVATATRAVLSCFALSYVGRRVCIALANWEKQPNTASRMARMTGVRFGQV